MTVNVRLQVCLMIAIRVKLASTCFAGSIYPVVEVQAVYIFSFAFVLVYF